MRINQFRKYRKQFELEFGFAFLKQTRKREYVEARAAFIYYLSKFKKVGLVRITDLIKADRGWKPNHATIHHSLKNYDMYCKYNPKIDSAVRNVIGYFRNTQDKQLYISNAIKNLDDDVVDRIHTEVVYEYKKYIDKEHESIIN